MHVSVNMFTGFNGSSLWKQLKAFYTWHTNTLATSCALLQARVCCKMKPFSNCRLYLQLNVLYVCKCCLWLPWRKYVLPLTTTVWPADKEMGDKINYGTWVTCFDLRKNVAWQTLPAKVLWAKKLFQANKWQFSIQSWSKKKTASRQPYLNNNKKKIKAGLSTKFKGYFQARPLPSLLIIFKFVMWGNKLFFGKEDNKCLEI